MAAELLDFHEAEIEQISLIPSSGGRFEVTVNGTLLYSKLKTGQHVEPGEIRALVEKYLKEGK
ncbi:MAG: Rdx family protein [Anaerolineaceae bacterium]|nr:Rdx family protein [Anaerolineaceae bacterium]